MIKVTNEQSTGIAIVWSGSKVANVTKKPAGWMISFNGKKSYCHATKAEAVAIAKRWIKESK